MNSKGVNMAVAAALLITAVVGTVIIDQSAAITWVTTTALNDTSFGIVLEGTTDTLTNNCGVGITGVYDWTNGTVVTSDNYTTTAAAGNRAATTMTWPTVAGGFVHNNTTIGVNYTYGCEYMANATARLIMEYYAIIAGVLVLVLAGGYIYLKGGF